MHLCTFTENIRTDNTTLPQTHVEKNRNVALETYRGAHASSMGRIRRKKQIRLESEARWKDNWEQSKENVKKLYT